VTAPAEQGGAEVVVLLHSLGTDAGLWAEQRAALSDRFRVIAPDSRGHGQSPSEGPVDVETWVADLHELVTRATDGRVHLVGLSMGGVQALAYAQAHPERVASLVLADTFSALDPRLAESKIEGIRAAVATDGMAAYAERYLADTLIGELPRDRREHLRNAIAGVPAEAYLASSEACFRADTSAGLADITAPTLVLIGEHDRKTPLSLSEEICRGIAGAELVTIPEAGHLSSVENPEAFTSALLDFLDRVAERRLPEAVR
jgi:3-oxoadipate enol-lactonase